MSRNINPTWSDYLKNLVSKMSDEEYRQWQEEVEKIKQRKPGSAADTSHIPLTDEELDAIVGKL